LQLPTAVQVRERQNADAPKATADYHAAQQALGDRTKKLRELRIARDAIENATG